MPAIDIFTGPNCGYCDAVKKLLAVRGLAYDERDVADPTIGAKSRERLP